MASEALAAQGDRAREFGIIWRQWSALLETFVREEPMMNETYFGVRICGPLATHAGGFRSWLICQRFYSPLTTDSHLRLMAHLSRWLLADGFDCSDLTENRMQEFVAARRAAGYYNLRTLRATEPLITYLREVGAAPEPVASIEAAPQADLLQTYRCYLSVDRRSAAGTVDNYVQLARRFLDFCAQRGVPDLHGVTADHLSTFVLSECARRPSGSARHAVTPLRALLRFGQLRGLTTADLALAVPRAVNRRGAGLPRSLTRRDITDLLTSCDRRTGWGRRDYAMLLMLARLGLRAGELAALRLEDVDWRAGEVNIPGKGGRRERLPLPDDVGQALVAYLRRGRPKTADRRVFVRFAAPRTGLSSGAITAVVQRAGVRAGVPVTGAHQLRHTVAVELLRAGAPMSEISELLRHRRTATTAIYAKVDRAALGPLARPWPVGAR
jgi:site-specific recombinase XerD